MRFIYERFKGSKTIYFLDEPMICDTETSHNHASDPEKAICWITSIQVLFNGKYHLFRYPSQFMEYLNNIIDTYKLDYNRRVRLVFHNASYDLSYLIGFMQRDLPGKDDMTILNDRHKIKAYRQGGIDIIDTYAISQVSLETWGKNLNVEHKKKIGLYNYQKIIFQDSELTESEKLYDKFDVLCLGECLQKQLKNYNDTIASIPYTSTGYNRRTFRRNAINNKAYKQQFRENRLHEDSFNMTQLAFSGGYTHGNRFYQSIIKGTIGHRDFRSHYPTQLRVMPMPFGKPQVTYDLNNKFDGEKIIKASEICAMYPDYFSIISMAVTFAQLKDEKITMPFMQKSKMFDMHTEKISLDNGRILQFKGYCTMIIDNLTLQILLDQYDICGKIVKVISYKCEPLPACLAETIDMFFKAKSDEKIKLKQYENDYGLFDDRTIEQEDVLRRAKAGLNGCYGMFVQNPCHEEYNVDYDEIGKVEDIFSPIFPTKTIEEQLTKYYDNYNSFLPYQVGVAVTACARFELYEYLTKAIGYENALYCDTDSIFYIKTPEIEQRIEALNREKNEKAEALGAYIINSQGKKIYYDVFEAEDDCKAFKQIHAKCYGVVQYDHKKECDVLKATIAGVPARTLIHMDGDTPIYLTREEELGLITPKMKLSGNDQFDPYEALDRIKDDFTFTTNTGTKSWYIVQKPFVKWVRGHLVETCGGCIIQKLENKTISDITNEEYEIEIVRGEMI